MKTGYYALAYHDLVEGTVTEIVMDEEYLVPIGQLLGMETIREGVVKVDDIEIIRERIKRIMM